MLYYEGNHFIENTIAKEKISIKKKNIYIYITRE